MLQTDWRDTSHETEERAASWFAVNGSLDTAHQFLSQAGREVRQVGNPVMGLSLLSAAVVAVTVGLLTTLAPQPATVAHIQPADDAINLATHDAVEELSHPLPVTVWLIQHPVEKVAFNLPKSLPPVRRGLERPVEATAAERIAAAGPNWTHVSERLDRSGSQAVISNVAATAASAVVGNTYEVKPGDSLAKIAQRFYGRTAAYDIIYKANRDLLPSPSAVRPGMILRIPPE